MAEAGREPGDDTGGEEGLIAVRRTKAAEVRARGSNPFANDVDASDRVPVAELRRRYAVALLDAATERYDADKVEALADAETVKVLGRVMARRGFGKAVFLGLRDATGEIQLFARSNVLGADFRALDDIDVGDHVEARGKVMVTKKGELSVELTALRLLTKALRPLPDKWHGLTDVEARHRRRYVDFIANPESRLTILCRSLVVQALRQFLDEQGFIEVETPTLHTLVGGAAARPFITHHNALDMSLFLRIAPELYLKRLLVGGLERVYEVGRCYRNEGISTRHNPEFTMLEFYQAYATYQTLMPMTEALIRFVDRQLGRELERRGLADFYAARSERRAFTLREPFVRLKLRDAVSAALRAAQLPPELLEQLEEGQLADLAGRSERASRVDWANLRRALAACPTEGDRLFVAYEYLAEPFLREDYRTESGEHSVPVFIMDYPAETSPLARRNDADPSIVDRFELFVDNKELCNAFSELNDPDEQAARFRDQVERKERGQAETMDYDEDYVRALEHGMPPAAGFGLGVDRLVMTLLEEPSIRDVIAFPLLRPEGR